MPRKIDSVASAQLRAGRCSGYGARASRRPSRQHRDPAENRPAARRPFAVSLRLATRIVQGKTGGPRRRSLPVAGPGNGIHSVNRDAALDAFQGEGTAL